MVRCHLVSLVSDDGTGDVASTALFIADCHRILDRRSAELDVGSVTSPRLQQKWRLLLANEIVSLMAVIDSVFGRTRVWSSHITSVAADVFSFYYLTVTRALLFRHLRRTRRWISHITQVAVDVSVLTLWLGGCSLTRLSFFYVPYCIATFVVTVLAERRNVYEGKGGRRWTLVTLGWGLGGRHATAGEKRQVTIQKKNGTIYGRLARRLATRVM